jgi:HK97 family phage major capsid protein
VNEQELRDGLAYVQGCLTDMHTRAEGRPLTEDEQRAWNEGATYVEETRQTLARYDQVRRLAAQPSHVERTTPRQDAGVHPVRRPVRRPHRQVAARARAERALVDANIRAVEGRDVGGADNERHFEGLLRRHESDHRWASNLLARSRPEYLGGFSKLMTGRGDLMTEEERAAMAVGTATAGGALVPTHLDPTLMLTNAGTSNVIRGISRVVTLTTGNVWHGVTTAGVTASWDGELTEVSDDSPAVAAVSVSTIQAQSLVQASIAAFQDIDGLTSDVMMLFADARDRLEGAAHATGSGTGQPKGIFTAVHASASLQVTSTTAAAIGLVDLHTLYRTLPVRWRGRGSWVMNPLYSLAVKALGTALSASYSTDITQAMAGSLLGRPLQESDDAPTTQTTTALDPEIVFGDFSGYTIVDMPGGFSIEFIPQMFNVANNLPDGRRAWFAYWRTGADATNLAAFRILEDKTSA